SGVPCRSTTTAAWGWAYSSLAKSPRPTAAGPMPRVAWAKAAASLWSCRCEPSGRPRRSRRCCRWQCRDLGHLAAGQPDGARRRRRYTGKTIDALLRLPDGIRVRMPRKIVSVLALLTVVLLVAVFGLAGGAYWFLRASLPQLDGERRLPGLTGEVVVERDGQGIATVRGERRLDVARATGFIHAQERFFQMDLLRRSAAGELAALVGPAAL